MKARILAAAVIAAAATPALAQGIDSRHSPYPASAYPGWVGNAPGFVSLRPVAPVRAAPAYRYSGQHAGGPADGLRW